MRLLARGCPGTRQNQIKIPAGIRFYRRAFGTYGHRVDARIGDRIHNGPVYGIIDRAMHGKRGQKNECDYCKDFLEMNH
jgi:hypothetical protein